MMTDAKAANGLPKTPGRPFPWVCPKCGQKRVRPAMICYHAERLHEDRLVAVDIPELEVPRCENCKELVFNYVAEEQILKAVQAQSAPSSAGGSPALATGEGNRQG
jgi:hypothetical protein